jgi:hypothetical protein
MSYGQMYLGKCLWANVVWANVMEPFQIISGFWIKGTNPCLQVCSRLYSLRDRRGKEIITKDETKLTLSFSSLSLSYQWFWAAP